MGALSMNVFLPSLPGMARDFGVEYGTMQLSVSAYLATSAMVQLLVGPLSDRWGRRPVMLAALAVFLLATLGTILAPSFGWFLAFRMVQAAITTGLVLSRAVVRDMVAGDAAASRIGYVTMGMSVVPMLAPMLGGLIDEAWGWRAVFYLLGAAGLAMFALVWTDMGETAAGGGTSLRTQVANYPVLARSVPFWGYALAATFGSGTFFAYVGGAPFVGEQVFHMTPAEVGYWFAAPSVGYMAGNYVSGRWSVRFGINRMIVTGAVLTVLALVLVVLADAAGLHQPIVFFGTVAVVGLGNGMVLPNANAGMMGVIPRLAGTASGLGGAMAVGGGAAMAAVAGAWLTPGAGAMPLLVIMLVSATASLLAVAAIIPRSPRARPDRQRSAD